MAADRANPASTPTAATSTGRRDHVHAPIRTSRLGMPHPRSGIATCPEQTTAGNRETEQGHQFGSTPRAREMGEAEGSSSRGSRGRRGGGQVGATAATGGVRAEGVGTRQRSSRDQRKESRYVQHDALSSPSQMQQQERSNFEFRTESDFE